MLAVKVPQGEDADPVEGFSFYVGGGSGPDSRLGRELWVNVIAERCPGAVEALLRVYLANRASETETFLEFTSRHEIEALKALVGETAP
jgi:ferredoxin-nitrite reductase